ncbi:MAG: DnaD domain protein [Eubacteriales bacterium]
MQQPTLSDAQENIIATQQLKGLISGYFLDAPAEYVKIYACAYAFLSEGNANFDDFCRLLNMSFNDVLNALEYWQQKGILRIVNDQTVKFEFILKKDKKEEDNLYTQAGYNETLQRIFGMRILNSNEYMRIYDFTDIFGLPKDVVLLLLEYCIKKKGNAVSVAYIEKVAKAWSQEGIFTIEDAVQKIDKQDLYLNGCRKVLDHLGMINRLPSQAEIALYNKWTKEWGFSLDAIKAACDCTTSASTPSLKYLDGILKNMHENGAIKTREVKDFNLITAKQSQKIRAILKRIGIATQTITLEHKKYYRKWTDQYGFSQEVILHAASIASKNSKPSLAYVDKILENLKKQKLFELPEIEKVDKGVLEQNNLLKEVFKNIGINKMPSEQDRIKYKKWREQGFSHEVILLAAKKSQDTQSPYKYLEHLLGIWKNEGILTVDQALKAAFKKSTNSAKEKLIAREYEKEDLNKIAVDLMADEEIDE